MTQPIFLSKRKKKTSLLFQNVENKRRKFKALPALIIKEKNRTSQTETEENSRVSAEKGKLRHILGVKMLIPSVSTGSLALIGSDPRFCQLSLGMNKVLLF